jgi:hypothetical protein
VQIFSFFNTHAGWKASLENLNLTILIKAEAQRQVQSLIYSKCQNRSTLDTPGD